MRKLLVQGLPQWGRKGCTKACFRGCVGGCLKGEHIRCGLKVWQVRWGCKTGLEQIELPGVWGSAVVCLEGGKVMVWHDGWGRT